MDDGLFIEKVPLNNLIQILIEARDSGAKFIDIAGISDEESDHLAIYIKKEYYEKDENFFDKFNIDDLIV